MKIYLEDKKTQIKNPDLEKGKLVPDKIKIKVDEVPYISQDGHYEVIKEYENGGKDVEFIITTPKQDYVSAQEYEKEINIYIPFTKKELKVLEVEKLRQQREIECFPIINRGKLWYDTLTDRQLNELDVWYHQWLDVTKIKIIPDKPTWLF